MRLRVDAVSEQRTSRNVIAELGDRTPRRIVMAGAHLDSVAEGPGLNDNGSGTAAVLDSAEVLGRQRRAPPRACSCASASGRRRSWG